MNVAHSRSPIGVGLQYLGLVALLAALLAPLLGLIATFDTTALTTGTIEVSAWSVAGTAVAFPALGAVVLGSVLNHS